MSEIPVEWLGHASFRLIGDKTIYIDPFDLDSPKKKADIILITHEHHDHCSIEDIEKVRTQKTKIFSPSVIGIGETIVVPGQTYTEGKIIITTVPAYNIGKRFHPKEKGWVGYIVTIGDYRIYHAGDTDLIPEMEKIKADIVLLPVGGTYTMTAQEAAQAANTINPKYAIPMHYGSIVGKEEDAKEFERLCKVKVYRLMKSGF